MGLGVTLHPSTRSLLPQDLRAFCAESVFEVPPVPRSLPAPPQFLVRTSRVRYDRFQHLIYFPPYVFFESLIPALSHPPAGTLASSYSHSLLTLLLSASYRVKRESPSHPLMLPIHHLPLGVALFEADAVTSSHETRAVPFCIRLPLSLEAARVELGAKNFFSPNVF